MSVLNMLQFKSKRADHPRSAPQENAAPPAPTTEGWHPDVSAGTLRWHGPGGTPTDRLAKWHD